MICEYQSTELDNKHSCLKAESLCGKKVFVDCSKCVDEAAAKTAAVSVLARRIIHPTSSSINRLDLVKQLASIDEEAAGKALVVAVKEGLSVESALKLAVDAQLKLD